MLRWIFALLFFCGSLLAHAAEVKQYNVDQATSLFQQGNFTAALQHFQSLLKTSKNKAVKTRLQWNVARCLEELGRFEEALKEFYGYKSIVSDRGRKARAEQKIQALVPKVFGSLEVSCENETSLNIVLQPASNTGKSEHFGPLECPASLTKLRSGRATVTSAGTDDLINETVVINPGQTHRLHLAAKAQTVDRKTVWIVGTLVGVAAIAGGIYLLSEDSSQKTALCFDCP